jgi:hypothetical protein
MLVTASMMRLRCVDLDAQSRHNARRLGLLQFTLHRQKTGSTDLPCKNSEALNPSIYRRVIACVRLRKKHVKRGGGGKFTISCEFSASMSSQAFLSSSSSDLSVPLTTVRSVTFCASSSHSCWVV